MCVFERGFLVLASSHGQKGDGWLLQIIKKRGTSVEGSVYMMSHRHLTMRSWFACSCRPNNFNCFVSWYDIACSKYTKTICILEFYTLNCNISAFKWMHLHITCIYINGTGCSGCAVCAYNQVAKFLGKLIEKLLVICIDKGGQMLSCMQMAEGPDLTLFVYACMYKSAS